jgi:hypothetical protein
LDLVIFIIKNLAFGVKKADTQGLDLDREAFYLYGLEDDDEVETALECFAFVVG